MIESGSCENASSGAPITTFDPASSTIAASSRPGSFADTGCGIAPIFQHARYATNQSTEFGTAIVTKSPSSIPYDCSSRPSRFPR